MARLMTTGTSSFAMMPTVDYSAGQGTETTGFRKKLRIPMHKMHLSESGNLRWVGAGRGARSRGHSNC